MSALLEVTGLRSGYGATPVLFGIDLTIETGAALAFVGRNGMGKSTTIRTIMGLNRATHGSVGMNGVDITAYAPHRVAQTGIAWVPEGRQVFPQLTVREHLLATAANFAGPATGWSPDEVFALFPRLRERRAHLGSKLSGGEAQMLAIGRALTLGPRLLILDEATEGLAPVIREEIWATIGRLRERAISILIVDKNLDALARVCERASVIEKGRIVWSGPAATLATQRDLHDRFLAI